ncbi:MAG: hypothetical protein AAGG01_03845, partial [Planctomycetota bacterium]
MDPQPESAAAASLNEPGSPPASGGARRPRKNEIVDVVIDRMDDRGRGLASAGGATLVIRFA